MAKFSKYCNNKYSSTAISLVACVALLYSQNAFAADVDATYKDEYSEYAGQLTVRYDF